MMKLMTSAVAVLAVTHAVAADLLPLHRGNYSSTTCNDPPNAALMTYDGQLLTGAHTSACKTRVMKTTSDRYSLTQTCPAEQVGGAAPAREMVVTEEVVILSSDSFQLSTNANSADARTFHRCSKN